MAQHSRNGRPGIPRLRVRGLIAVAAVLVGDPAERTGIGHAHRHRLAGARHGGGVERALRDDLPDFVEKGGLRAPVQLLRIMLHAIFAPPQSCPTVHRHSLIGKPGASWASPKPAILTAMSTPATLRNISACSIRPPCGGARPTRFWTRSGSNLECPVSTWAQVPAP